MSNMLFIVCVGIFLVISRLYIASTNADLVLVMAIINTIALDYVVLIIVNETLKNFKCRLINSGFSDNKKKRFMKKAKFIGTVICFIIFIAVSIIYIWKFRSADINDVLSIVALVFSIITNPLTKYLGGIMYGFI